MSLIFDDNSMIYTNNDNQNTIFNTNDNNNYISLFNSKLGIHSNIYLNNIEISKLLINVKNIISVDLIILNEINVNGIIPFISLDPTWINNNYIIPYTGLYNIIYNRSNDGLNSININNIKYNENNNKGTTSIIIKCNKNDKCSFIFNGILKPIEDNYITKATIILIKII